MIDFSMGRFPVAEFPLEFFQISGDPGLIRSSLLPWGELSRTSNEVTVDIRQLSYVEWRAAEAEAFRQRLRELEPALESVAVDFGTMYQHVLEFSHKLEELQHEMNRVKNRAYILWKSIRGRLLHLYSSDSGSALGTEDIIRGLHADYEEWNREVENASRLRAEESAAVNLCARAINDLGEPHQQVLSSAQLARREARGQAAPPDPSRPMSLAWLGAISCAHQAGLFSHVLEDLGIDAQSVVDDSWTAPHGELVMIAVAAY